MAKKLGKNSDSSVKLGNRKVDSDHLASDLVHREKEVALFREKIASLKDDVSKLETRKVDLEEELNLAHASKREEIELKLKTLDGQRDV